MESTALMLLGNCPEQCVATSVGSEIKYIMTQGLCLAKDLRVFYVLSTFTVL